MKKNTIKIRLKTVILNTYLVLLLGFCGLMPNISQAETGGGTNNANKEVVAIARDPFWPVGYQPKRIQGQEEIARQQILAGPNSETDWDVAMSQVIINGVSSRGGNEYIAVINNEVKMLGESVSIWFGGTRYTWKVESIAPPGSVKLRRVTAQ